MGATDDIDETQDDIDETQDDIDETQDDVQEEPEANTEDPDTGQTGSDTGLDTNGIDSRLDAIEEMIQRMNGTMNKIVSAQSALVENGVIYDVDDTDPSDDDNVGSARSSVLDLSIDDID